MCRNLHDLLQLDLQKCRRVGPSPSIKDSFGPPGLRARPFVARAPHGHHGPQRQFDPQGRGNPGPPGQSLPLNRPLLPRPRYLVTTQSCPPPQSQLWRPFRRVDRLTDFTARVNLYKRRIESVLSGAPYLLKRPSLRLK